MARQMKNSGVEWIGKIPEGWKKYQFKTILTRNDGGVWGEDPTDDGVNSVVLRSTEQTVDGKWDIQNPALRNLSAIGNLNEFLCKEDDLLITKSSGSDLHIGKTTIVDTLVASMNCYYSNFMQRLRVNDSCYPKFYWYILNSCIARSQFAFLQNSTSGIGNINAKYIDSIYVPYLPKKEQQRIADFLDKKCSAIDDVLAKTQESIEEYKKLKQAVITEAVTKGVRGKRPMKDSGVPWFGKVPVDVSISKIGRHYDIILGKMLCDAPKSDNMRRIPYICAANVHFDGVDTSELKQMWFTPDEIELYQVVDGDLLIVEGGAGAGGCAIAHNIEGVVGIQNSIQIIRSKDNADNRFLCYALQSLVKSGYMDVACNKATLPHYTKDKLSNTPYLVWSKEEQQEIADYLDKKCAAIDNLISKKQQFIEELTAYKKSLIYEYVTGKKEVPA